MSLTRALSSLVYLDNVLFVETVLQGTLSIEKSQDGVWWYVGVNKFKTILEVVSVCGQFTQLRMFDTVTEEETIID